MSKNPDIGNFQLRDDAVAIDRLFVGRFRTTAPVTHRKTVGETILAQVLRGRYEIGCRRERTLIAPGEMVLVPAGVPVKFVHHPDPAGGVMEARWMHLHATVFGVVDLPGLYRLPLRLDRRRAAPLGRVIGELLRAPRPGPAGALHQAMWRNELGFKVLRLLSELAPLQPAARESLGRSVGLAPLFREIRAHLAESLEIRRLAGWAGLSPSRLHAVFQTQLGVTPMAYVKRLRLAEARRLLVGTGLSVKQVAAATGFSCPFHFSRVFKAETWTSPSVYRGQMQPGVTD